MSDEHPRSIAEQATAALRTEVGRTAIARHQLREARLRALAQAHFTAMSREVEGVAAPLLKVLRESEARLTQLLARIDRLEARAMQRR